MHTKLLREGLGEPIVARGAALLYPLQALRRERHHSLPPIMRIGRTSDETSLLQWRNYLAHGLLAHAFSPRQVGNGCRTMVFEAHKNRNLGGRQVLARVFAYTKLEHAIYRANFDSKRSGDADFSGRLSDAHIHKAAY